MTPQLLPAEAVVVAPNEQETRQVLVQLAELHTNFWANNGFAPSRFAACEWCATLLNVTLSPANG